MVGFFRVSISLGFMISKGVKISFAGLVLTDFADVVYGVSRSYEGGSDACPPSSIAETVSVTMTVNQIGFQAIEATVKKLKDYLASNPVGTLLVADSTGGKTIDEFTDLRINSDSIPGDWRQYQTEFTVSFSRSIALAVDPDLNSRVLAVEAPGVAKIDFTRLNSYSENWSNQYFDRKVNTAKENLHSIESSGVEFPDQNLSREDQFTWLIDRRDLIEAAAKAGKGTVTFGSADGYDMKLNTFSAEIDCGKLRWSLSASRTCFPEDSAASTEIETSFEKNHESGDWFLSVTGTICASTKDAAYERLDAIKTSFSTGRSLLAERSSDKELFEENGDITWIELRFDLRWRDFQSEVVNFDWTEDRSTDCESGIDVLGIQGSITAKSLDAARAKLQALLTESGNHPGWLLRTRETIAFEAKGEDATKRLVSLGFSYEYRDRNQCVFITVNSETNEDCFAGNRYSVRGRVVAPSESLARQRANAFKVDGYLLLSGSWSVSAEQFDADSRDTAYDFSFNYAMALTKTSAQYTRDVTNNYDQLSQTITYSGAIKAPTKNECEAKIASITRDVGNGARKLSDSLSESYRECEGGEIFDGCSFSVSFEADLAPLADIIDASVTLDFTYSEDHVVITPRPFDRPHVQTDLGLTPGRCVVSTNATGRSQSVLESWSRARRSLAPNGGHKKPATERASTQYKRYSLSQVQLVTFSGNYPFEYDVLAL